MSGTKHDREKLLAETFHGDWADGTAADIARRAAAHARFILRVRRALTASGIAAACAVALVLSLRPPTVKRASIDARGRTAPACEIISDDELLAQLKDRPLLVQHHDDGSREIVLLEN